jgi:hypothetical protein
MATLYGTINADELLFPVGPAGVAPPLLVTIDMETGLVVVQVRVGFVVQVSELTAMVQVEDAGVRVPDMTRATNVATTVQSAVTAFVVYVFPTRVPPQVPPTDDSTYPEFGVTVNDVAVL